MNHIYFMILCPSFPPLRSCAQKWPFRNEFEADLIVRAGKPIPAGQDRVRLPLVIRPVIVRDQIYIQNDRLYSLQICQLWQTNAIHHRLFDPARRRTIEAIALNHATYDVSAQDGESMPMGKPLVSQFDSGQEHY